MLNILVRLPEERAVIPVGQEAEVEAIPPSASRHPGKHPAQRVAAVERRSIPPQSLHEERAAPMCSLSPQGPKEASGASQPGRGEKTLNATGFGRKPQSAALASLLLWASFTCCEAHSTRHGHAHSAAYLIEQASAQSKMQKVMDGELWKASFPIAVSKTPASRSQAPILKGGSCANVTHKAP